MEVVWGILLFLAGTIMGAIVMALAQAKRAFEVEHLREELKRKIKLME